MRWLDTMERGELETPTPSTFAEFCMGVVAHFVVLGVLILAAAIVAAILIGAITFF